jgi:hypothetical protein
MVYKLGWAAQTNYPPALSILLKSDKKRSKVHISEQYSIDILHKWKSINKREL